MNIELTSLKKTFGKKVAVDIDNYAIHSGEILGLVGNNGAGKSTLFRLILDLIKADQGHVVMCADEGQALPLVTRRNTSVSRLDVSQSEGWKDWTGAYIDDSFLIDYLTPEEYFQFIGRISNVDGEELAAQLNAFKAFITDEIVGQKKLIRNLSAGNKQKVGIVAAMLLKPQVLILDEPFNFLDPSSQNIIKHLLTEYNQRTGATILVSSHNLAHTVDICHRIALLESGRIIRDIDNCNHQAEKELADYFDVK